VLILFIGFSTRFGWYLVCLDNLPFKFVGVDQALALFLHDLLQTRLRVCFYAQTWVSDQVQVGWDSAHYVIVEVPVQGRALLLDLWVQATGFLVAVILRKFEHDR
jgi:hypothetical protein